MIKDIGNQTFPISDIRALTSFVYTSSEMREWIRAFFVHPDEYLSYIRPGHGHAHAFFWLKGMELVAEPYREWIEDHGYEAEFIYAIPQEGFSFHEEPNPLSVRFTDPVAAVHFKLQFG